MNRLNTIVLAVALALSGCGSTTIVSSWRDPAALTTANFARVLVVAPARDPSLRRTAEDELAKRIRNAVPSYTVFSDADIQHRDMLRNEARARGFDGLVVFHVVSVNQQTSWVPGAYWGPAYAYGGWPMWDPGYVTTDTLVRVDTDVYDLRYDKLVWASASRTYNPGSVKSLVDDVTKAVTKRMRDENLL